MNLLLISIHTKRNEFISFRLDLSFLKELGIEEINSGSCYGPDGWGSTENKDLLDVITPITGEVIAKVAKASEDDYETVVSHATKNFESWKKIPAP